MEKFKQYRRTQIAEMREVNNDDIEQHSKRNAIVVQIQGNGFAVSISPEDLKNGSPKIGDMIARNPKNHEDQWLVAKKDFEDNFEPMR